MTADLVDRTKIPVENALKDAGLTNADIDKVILMVVPHGFLPFKKLLRAGPVRNQITALTLTKRLP